MIIKNDAERITRYYEILSESNVKEFQGLVMTNGPFEQYDQMFDIYRDFKKSPFGTFNDTKLQSALNKFDESFKKLDIFLTENHKWEFEPDIGFYPRRWKAKESKNLDTKQVQQLLSDFEFNYKNLVSLFSKYFRRNVTEVVSGDGLRYVYKSGGDFFYGKNGSKIKFQNHHRKYYFLFCALYDLAEDDKVIEYKDLITHLNRSYRQKFKTSQDIINCIRNSIFRNSRKYNLNLGTPDNQSLIDIVKGEGVVFHNPRI